MNEAHVLMDNQSTIDLTLYNVVSLFAKAGSAQYLQIQVLGAGAQAFANFDVRNQKVTKMGRLAVRANIFQGFNDSARCVLCVKGSGNTVGSVKYSLINDPLAKPDVFLSDYFCTVRNPNYPQCIFLCFFVQKKMPRYTLTAANEISRNKPGRKKPPRGAYGF